MKFFFSSSYLLFLFWGFLQFTSRFFQIKLILYAWFLPLFPLLLPCWLVGINSLVKLKFVGVKAIYFATSRYRVRQSFIPKSNLRHLVS
ncbi:hypothetical protein QR685DRAFT_254396 [Neurospora intermedia]|uniref:Uncharacterized protein n=1 Tax=Neurospora intermedia TaxID=5142 RepID=A0ABR3DEZ6_NEUIN